MNKHCFRLIFSKTLGFLIPVAETSHAARKPGQTQAPSTPSAGLPPRWTLNALPLALAALLPNAYAGITVEPNQRTAVGQSENGVPVVDIANPNNQGLSHNRFTEFNVNQPGVIFNNSLRTGTSQIGGTVMLNPNLNREASAILTEVTGNGPTTVSGTMEVFGGRADLLIANPNGVTLNGVQTYNASSLTVTTGRVNADNLQFTVNDTSGRVVIGADGVNTQGLTFFDIVARGVDLNGQVGSESRNTDIQVVAGRNTYDAAKRTLSTNTTSPQTTPQVAIAGGAAGAMHGRFINLISTETGAGVRHEGLIRAEQDIRVSSAGDIALAAVLAGNNATLTSAAAITLGDSKAGNGAQAGGLLALKAAGNIAINNDVQTDRFTAEAKQLQINAATLKADGSQQEGSAKAVTLNVDDFVLMGEMQMYTSVSELLATDPLVTKEGKLQLKLFGGKYSDDFTLRSTAKLLSGGGIDITAKNFTNHEGLIADSSTRGISISADHIVNQGVLQTQGDLTLTAAVLDNLCAQGASLGGTNQTLCGGFFAAGEGTVKAALMNSNGGIVAGKGLTVELGEGTHSIGKFGGIGAGQNLVVKPAAGKKASLNIAGEMTAGQDLNVALQALTAAPETSIKAGGDATLNVEAALTNGGEISSGATLTLNTTDLKSTTGSTLQSAGDTVITVSNDIVNEKDSAMITLADFSMKAGGKMYTAASINVGGQKALLQAEDALVNAAGSIISTQDLEIKSGAALTNESGSLTNADGQLKLQSVGDMLNNENSILSGTDVIATVGGTLRNALGSFFDGKNVSIEAQNIVNSGLSKIAGYDALTIVARENFSNEGGARLESKKAIAVTAGGTLTNDKSSINAPTLQLNGKTVTNSNTGEILGNTVGITASDSLTTQTNSLLRGDKVAINASLIKGSNSSILAKENLDVVAREVQSTATIHSKNTTVLSSKKGENLQITTGSKVPTADNLLTINTKDLTVDGSLKTASNLAINATGKVSNSGEIIGSKNLTINANEGIDNLANALIWAGEDAWLKAGSNFTNGKNALIRAAGTLTLKARNALTNQTGRIDAGGNVNIDAARLENRSEVAGDVTTKVIGDDRGYGYSDNWYGDDWGVTEKQYFHTELWIPRYSGEALTVQQGIIKAGGNLQINQQEQNGYAASVRNLGGLMAAAGDINVYGDVNNLGAAKNVSLTDYMKASSAFAQWTNSSISVKNDPPLHTNLYDLLDKSLFGIDGPYGYGGGFQWDNSLKLTSSPEGNALLSAVLGADWRSLDHATLNNRWKAFKAAPDRTLDIYADKQAELSAGGNFVQTGGSLTNGTSANWGKNRQVDVQIGDEKLVTVAGDLDALFNRNSAFDVSNGTDLKALHDAINSAKLQQELMSNNPLFSANPPPMIITADIVDPAHVPAANLTGTEFKGVYPLYTSRVSFDPAKFLGSDYLFKKVGYNPEKTVTVLGDAYFDNELITRTIEQTVGNFFAVNRQLSGNTLVQNLLDNGATQATKLGLVMGQPLTAAQYEKLDSDIVWYEPQMVNGISVLAPKVYVSKNTLLARQKDQKNGALITAKNVLIDAEAVNNINGVIRGNNDTLVYAKKDINNVSQGGTDTGIYGGAKGRLAMAADGEINNRGGNSAGLQQTVAAGNGVTNSATTGYATDGSLYVRDNAQMGAGTTLAGTKRKTDELASKAKQQNESAAGNTSSPVTTVATARASTSAIANSEQPASTTPPAAPKSQERTAYEALLAQHKAGDLAKDAESSVTVTSGGNIDLSGSRTGADTVTLQAKGDVNLNDIHEVGSSFKSESTKGILSSKHVTDMSGWAASKGNDVTANQLNISAGGNLNMTGGVLNTQGSTVKVTGDMTVAAAKDLAFHEVKTDTFGFVIGSSTGAGGWETNASWDANSGGSTFAGKGAGSQSLATNGSAGQRAINNANAARGATTGATFRLGFESVSTTETSKAKNYSNAQLNLGSGTVDVGGTFDFGGADINKKEQVSAADRNALATGKTPSFNTALSTLAVKAGDIKTTKFENTFSNTLERETIFVGLSGEGHSTAVDVGTNIANRVQKATDGMKPIGGDEAGDDALNIGLIAAETVGNATQLAFGEVAGGSVSLGAKITQEHAESKSTQQNVNLVGGTISMTSTKGDIDLNGVKIAGNKVALDSAGSINQTAAVSTKWDKAKTDVFTAGLTASIGVTAKGDAGVGLSGEVGGVHDRTETNAKSHTNGLIAGTDITIKTKDDHTITGANIIGNAVNVDVGGTQTIASVQDTSNMDHERGSWGVSGGVAWDLKELAAGKFLPKPTGSVSASGGKDYDNSAITAVQSGIDSGKLNLAVAGDQKLTGAHIINRSGQGSFSVDGETTAKSLTDTRDKDGGYAGGSAGINRNGIAQVTVQTGRVDQVRYDAEQHATIDLNGGKAVLGNGVSGTLNNDDTKLVTVNKDYTVQGTDIKVDVNPGQLKKGKGSGVDGVDGPEAQRPGTDVIDVPDRPTITKPSKPATRDIEDGPIITLPTKPAATDTPDRTIINKPGGGSTVDGPAGNKPPQPGTSDIVDGPTITKPSTPKPSDTPDRTSIAKADGDSTVSDPSGTKPTTSDIENGPTVTKPSKPATDDSGNTVDDGTVKMRPESVPDNATEVTFDNGPTSLRNVLDRFHATSDIKAQALKDNPIVLNMENGDGTRSRIVISSPEQLEALNGRQVIFRKGNTSDPKDSNQYLQINRSSDGTYGFEYKSSAGRVQPLEPINRQDPMLRPASEVGGPAVVTPPRFSNITTEVEEAPPAPQPPERIWRSGVYIP